MRLTAVGSGYYTVSVNGVEVSRHTTEREAIEAAVNREQAKHGEVVRYRHDYVVKVEDDVIPVLADPGTAGGGPSPEPTNNPPQWVSFPSVLSATAGISASFNLSGYVLDLDGPSAVTIFVASGTLPVGWTFVHPSLNFDGRTNIDLIPASIIFRASDGLFTTDAGVSVITYLGTQSTEQDWIARSTAAGVVKAEPFLSTDKASYRNAHDTFYSGNPSEDANISIDNTGADGLYGNALKIVTPNEWGGTNAAAFKFLLNPAWTSNMQTFTGPWWLQVRIKVDAGWAFTAGRTISHSGTAQTAPGPTNQIKLASTASSTDNFYAGKNVYILSGTGIGQSRRISSYSGTTKIATVSSVWTTGTPTSDSAYYVYEGAGGRKIFNLAHASVSNPDAGASHPNCEIVCDDLSQRGFPDFYNAINTGSGYNDFSEPYGAFDRKRQNAVDNGAQYSNPEERYCLWRDSSFNPTYAGCQKWLVDGYMTLMVRVNIATYGAQDTNNGNQFDCWVAYPGDTAWTHTHTATGFPIGSPDSGWGGINGIHVLNYDTNRNGGPGCTMWYKQFIVSTQAIAIPNDFQVPSTYPTWRQGAAINSQITIAGTAQMSGYQWPTDPRDPAVQSNIVDAWNGFARVGNKWYSAAQGGHGDWQNTTLAIDLNTDNPVWSELDNGSTYDQCLSNYTLSYMADGTPVSRHGYYGAVGVEAGKLPDGLARVMLFGCSGAWAIGSSEFGPNPFQGGNRVDGYKIVANAWDIHDTWPVPGNPYSSRGATCSHPVTGDVYLNDGGFLYKFTVASGTWVLIVSEMTGPQAYPSPNRLQAWYDRPMLIDPVRNQAVCLYVPESGSGTTRLQIAKLDGSQVVSYQTPTGHTFSTSRYQGMVYDPDNDVYLVQQASGGLYEIDPDTYVATLVVSTPNSVIPSSGQNNGVMNRFQYFPALGGVAYLPYWTSAIIFIPRR